MNNELTLSRKEASIQSKGLSGQEIYETVIEQVSFLERKERILDVGCGTGLLLGEIHKRWPSLTLAGADLTDFSKDQDRKYNFIKCDLNDEFTIEKDSFDLVTSIEVIEHLENPRQYLRSLTQTVKIGGYLFVSTPNLDSWTSIISFVLRGYHSAFGPRDYPAHITPLSHYELTQIGSEIDGLKLVDTIYIRNGRIPGTGFQWKSIFPFLNGKRYSDNYLCIFKKES